MRKAFVAGNWKMNLSVSAASELAATISEQARQLEGVDIAICPVFVQLLAVQQVLSQRDSLVLLGAQNMYFESSGAFTGEVSGVMLRDVGCHCVILGHSERRQMFHETDAMVHKKVGAATASGLIPIICVGETLQQREAGQTKEVIKQQFLGCLAGHPPDAMSRVVIAYEPVWAIGTGQVATVEQAEEVHSYLRELLEIEYNRGIAERVRLQYGGSVKPDNAAELLKQPNIDGALVGGASLSADSFLAILKAAADTAR